MFSSKWPRAARPLTHGIGAAGAVIWATSRWPEMAGFPARKVQVKHFSGEFSVISWTLRAQEIKIIEKRPGPPEAGRDWRRYWDFWHQALRAWCIFSENLA